MQIADRLRSAVRRHSLATIPQLLAKNLVHFSRELLSGRLLRKQTPSGFDLAHGTDTERICEVGSLNIESDNARHAVRYQPSPQALASKLINSLPIDHPRFTFLDFGAGKGRVLLIAAELPFSAVIGIEFSPRLCAVATSNIGRLAPGKRRAARVECHYDDVSRYPLPEVPLVCYFYNPFDAAIMRAVVDRLTASLKHSQRDVYVIYVHPEHRVLFDSAPHWSQIDHGQSHVVYRARLDRLAEPAA